MVITPWRPSLNLALHRNRAAPEARFVQLATLRDDGGPANRTVVFRGFLDATGQLVFITDGRSRKAAQIERFPRGEACWYFPRSREQFRFSGRLALVRADHPDGALLEFRRLVWRGLSAAARRPFAWPAPGAARAPSSAYSTAPADPEQPLIDFCLLMLDPTEVDHLELLEPVQARWLYRLDENARWTAHEINP
jgi:PPOX class probable FMN-dependent enzyme